MIPIGYFFWLIDKSYRLDICNGPISLAQTAITSALYGEIFGLKVNSLSYNKSIDMYKIRQILRLYADGRGSKFISSTMGIARNTVKKYLAQFASLGLSLQDIERMSDGQLASIFLPEKPVEGIPRVDQLAKMLPELVAMLRKRGITKSGGKLWAKCGLK